MRAIATKQPTNDSAKQKKKGSMGRSAYSSASLPRSFFPLSIGMPVLQRKCACGGGCPRCQEDLGIQTKLKIGEPGDKYEQEADHIADEVMRMPEPSVQRQVEPEEEEEEMVQRKAIANPISSVSQKQDESEVSSLVDEVLRSPGQPLDRSTRDSMESSFGHDFSQVRIHSDKRAVQSNLALGAYAYTVGNHIAFGESRFSPGTLEGKKLLAHELAHVVQQSQVSGQLISAQFDFEEIGKAVVGPTGLAPAVSKIGEIAQKQIEYATDSLKSFLNCISRELQKVSIPKIKLDRTLPLVPNYFILGVLEGIPSEIYETITGIPELLLAIPKMLEVLGSMFTPAGKEIACGFGTDIGKQFVDDIKELSAKKLSELAFEIGKIIGPILFDIIISIFFPGSGLVRRGAWLVVKVGEGFKRGFKRLVKVGDKRLPNVEKALRTSFQRPKTSKFKDLINRNSSTSRKVITKTKALQEVQQHRPLIRPSSMDGYTHEIPLLGGHFWRRTPDGKWCRFASPPDCSIDSNFNEQLDELVGIAPGVKRRRRVDVPEASKKRRQAELEIERREAEVKRREEEQKTQEDKILVAEDVKPLEGFDKVRETPNMDLRKVSFTSSSRNLAIALERGIPSRPKPAPGYEAHHIIPHGETRPVARQLRFYLRLRTIGIDEAVNGAWLPRGRGTPVIPGTNPILHDFTMGEGLTEYLTALQKIFLEDNGTAPASKVRSILGNIGEQLENGIFPPEYPRR